MSAKKSVLYLISFILLVGLYLSSTVLATPLTDMQLYFNPDSAEFDFYPRILLPDLSVQNTVTWDAGSDSVVDADILPVLKPGTYPVGYSFSQNDYYQTPNVDYSADLTAGTLTATFMVSGQYLVRVTRQGGSSQIYTVFAEADLLELPGESDTTGPSRKIPGPTGDVVIVATGDKTLDQAATNITNQGQNVKRATGVADTVQKIRDAAVAAGRKIHVELVGHGAPGMISMNNSNTADENLIGDTTGDTSDVDEFQNAIDEYCNKITLFSCRSGDGSAGDNLLRKLASSIGYASAWTVTINVESGYFTVHYKEQQPLSITTDPNLATKPWPVTWSVTDVERVKPLSWTKGRNAASHDVYFGTDETAVHDATTSIPMGVYRGQQAKDVNTYPLPDTLQMNQTYYWRIDEVNVVSGKIWPGFVWRFTVADYLTVDDFESYNNTSNNIRDTWKAVGNASVRVGYTDTNYAEVMVGLTPNSRIHGGRQAMPFDYNNLKPPFDSNVYRDFGTSPQDWTRLDVKELSLWLRGYPVYVGSFTKSGSEPNYIYTMTAAGTDFNVPDWRHPSSNFRDEFHYAYIPVPNTDYVITAEVNSLTQAGTNQSRAALMIRDSLNDNSRYALVSIASGGAGLRFENRPTTGDVLATGAYDYLTVPQISPPYWLRLERHYDSGNIYYNAYYSSDGVTWYPVGGWDYIDTTIIVMAGTEDYIGLAVTAGNACSTCTAVFSNVSVFEGYVDWDGSIVGEDVTPSWPWPNPDTDIGIKSNTAAPLSVTLQDAGQKTATVTYKDSNNNVDPNIVLACTWQEWNIALSEFKDKNQGLDLTAIKKITIGVGDANGVGTLYFDDIRLYPSRCLSEFRPTADFTCDCVVDYRDFAVLANEWFYTGCLRADLYKDCKVDLRDLAILAENWLEEGWWP